MKETIGPFNGFSTDAFKFLQDLRDNNNSEWFNKNRNRYQTSLVQSLPARLLWKWGSSLTASTCILFCRLPKSA
ncbi:MAG: DUF2461 family protein [Ignavibacteria bacterium]